MKIATSSAGAVLVDDKGEAFGPVFRDAAEAVGFLAHLTSYDLLTELLDADDVTLHLRAFRRTQKRSSI